MQVIKHISGIIILTFVVGMFSLTDRIPYSDEYVYLGHGYTLYSKGVFGTVDKNTDESIPDARFAPITPITLAGIMLINERFAKSVNCYLTTIDAERQNCPNELFIGKALQLLLFSCCLSYIWLLLFNITGSKLFSYLTAAMLLLSGTPYHYADHFLTESLYLGFAFIFLLSLPLAILKQSIKYTIISAIFLALTALVRPTYLYLFYLLLLVIPLLLIFKEKYFLNIKHFIKFYSVFFIVFSLIVGPWMARSAIYFDKFAITVGYGDKPLATRVAHNDMTDKEFLAGWIYWLPDFGDSLAENLFGKENTHRLSFSSPQSFYPEGRHKVDTKISEAMDVGIDGKKYSSRMEALMNLYVYPDILNHAKVTLLLAWRGFFVDKYFAFFGLFFLIWAIAGGIKEQSARYFQIILIPPMLLLFFQAAVSVSIPRYNLILLLPISIAYSASFYILIHKIFREKGREG
jgi:hypothetical protein